MFVMARSSMPLTMAAWRVATASNQPQRRARPVVAPPGVPVERLEALRAAFAALASDTEFLADAEKSQLEVNPVSGEEVEQLVKDVYQTPKALADKAADFIRH